MHKKGEKKGREAFLPPHAGTGAFKPSLATCLYDERGCRTPGQSHKEQKGEKGRSRTENTNNWYIHTGLP